MARHRHRKSYRSWIDRFDHTNAHPRNKLMYFVHDKSYGKFHEWVKDNLVQSCVTVCSVNLVIHLAYEVFFKPYAAEWRTYQSVRTFTWSNRMWCNCRFSESNQTLFRLVCHHKHSLISVCLPYQTKIMYNQYGKEMFRRCFLINIVCLIKCLF